MKGPRFNYKVPKGKSFYLPWITDIHEGYRDIDYARLQSDIDRARDEKHCAIFLGGDHQEAIPKSDSKRYQPASIHPKYRGLENPMDHQELFLCKMFKPVKDKIEIVHPGNHEYTLLHQAETNVAFRLAQRLNAEYVGTTAITVIRFESSGYRPWTVSIFSTHGDGTGATTSSGQMNYLKKISAPFDTDIAMMGHVHHLLCDNCDTHLEITRHGSLKSRVKHYLISGTYMRTYALRDDGSAGYGERRHYSPSALGCGHVEFIPSERIIRAHDWWS